MSLPTLFARFGIGVLILAALFGAEAAYNAWKSSRAGLGR
jgi:hypothetical protein